MRPYQINSPPDESENYPPTAEMSENIGTPDPAMIEIVECERMHPCGHLFRESDIIRWSEGDIRDIELGERVMNPRSPVQL